MADIQTYSLQGQFDPKPREQQLEQHRALSPDVLKALANPKGYMEEQQMGQIAQRIADIKTEKIFPDLQNLALNEITNYKDEVFKMFNSNQGIDKFQLNGKQIIDEGMKYRNLLSNVNTLNKWTEDYNKILTEGHADIKGNNIDPKEYQAWEDKVNTMAKTAKTIGELPHLQILYNQMVHPKVKPVDLAKEQTEISNLQEKLITFVGGGSKGQGKVDMTKVEAMLPYVSDDQLSAAKIPGKDREAKIKALRTMTQSGMPLKNEQSFNFSVEKYNDKKENGKPKIESVGGDFPVSAYNMRVNGTINVGKDSFNGTKEIQNFYTSDDGKFMVQYNATYRSGKNIKNAVNLEEEVTPDLITKLSATHDVTELRNAYEQSKKGSSNSNVINVPDVKYTSSKSKGEFSRKDIIKNFVDAKGRTPTPKEWDDIVNQLGLKAKK